MTTVTQEKQIAFDDAGFQSVLDARNEPQWLQDMRKDAWKKFNELPWPSNRMEEWMRTDIRMFKLEKFGLKAESSSSDLPKLVLGEGVDLAGSVGTLDSHPESAAELADEYKAKGVICLLYTSPSPRD